MEGAEEKRRISRAQEWAPDVNVKVKHGQTAPPKSGGFSSALGFRNMPCVGFPHSLVPGSLGSCAGMSERAEGHDKNRPQSFREMTWIIWIYLDHLGVKRF